MEIDAINAVGLVVLINYVVALGFLFAGTLSLMFWFLRKFFG